MSEPLVFSIHLDYLIVVAITGTLAVVFNIIEIRLITKSLRKATHFEIILLNLAVADVLSAAMFLIKVGISAYLYANNSLDYKLVFKICILNTIPCTSSIFFIVVIGIERLMAVKSPLKHRFRTSSRRTTVRYVTATWIMTLALTATAVIYVMFIIKNDETFARQAAKIVEVSAVTMSVAMVSIFGLYSWVGYLLRRRDSMLFQVSSKVAVTKSIIKGLHREGAAIIMCILVVISYIACNLPLIVSAFKGRILSVDIILLSLNSVLNPLIYFFKGYAEKLCAKHKIKIISSEMKEQKNNGEVGTPKALASNR